LGLTRDQFRELFERQRDPLYRFLYRLTGNRADAEDLLQDAFAAVWRKRDRYEGRGSLEGFLRSTAYRLFLNEWKKTARRRDLAPPPEPERVAPPAAGEVAEREAHGFLIAKVREALAQLPDASREAFELFRFQGWTAREISEATDTPVKTVETRVRRATLALAESLGRYRHLQAG
jgi:RNA polymerase sigma-70 factor (ECF subfamily)